MNEKLQYASMLEIPVNTCNVTFKPAKKKRLKKKRDNVSPEQVKELLLEKVNSVEAENAAPIVEDEPVLPVSTEEFSTASVKTQPKKKKKFGFSVIAVELALIGVLTATIFLTNFLYEDSAINAFMKSVFGTSAKTETVVKNYNDYAPVMSFGVSSDFTVENGYLNYGGSGSVYSPLDGEVVSVTKTESGLYDMEIKISDNFISVFSGLKYAYANIGDKVFGNIPVGYVEAESLKMCFKSGDGNLITGYSVENGAVIWEV